MKILSLLITVIVINSILSKEQLKLSTENQTDKTGESSNYNGGRVLEAVTWGYAKNDGYILSANAVRTVH
jgi:hypothetical protein